MKVPESNCVIDNDVKEVSCSLEPSGGIRVQLLRRNEATSSDILACSKGRMVGEEDVN
jgi:hypothetical protein